jgi:hypothetical protein
MCATPAWIVTSGAVRLNAATTLRSEDPMKVQATVRISFRADSLADAGAVLDDVLGRARERDDVDVAQAELVTPPGDGIVTLPPLPTTVSTRPATA